MSFPTNAQPDPTDSGSINLAGPIEPNTPTGGRTMRPFVEDVQFRLVGTTLDITAALDVLREVFTVSGLSNLETGRGRRVRLYGTLSRRVPYSGGLK